MLPVFKKSTVKSVTVCTYKSDSFFSCHVRMEADLVPQIKTEVDTVVGLERGFSLCGLIFIGLPHESLDL